VVGSAERNERCYDAVLVVDVSFCVARATGDAMVLMKKEISFAGIRTGCLSVPFRAASNDKAVHRARFDLLQGSWRGTGLFMKSTGAAFRLRGGRARNGTDRREKHVPT
jgi:hypothetical protein